MFTLQSHDLPHFCYSNINVYYDLILLKCWILYVFHRSVARIGFVLAPCKFFTGLLALKDAKQSKKKKKPTQQRTKLLHPIQTKSTRINYILTLWICMPYSFPIYSSLSRFGWFSQLYFRYQLPFSWVFFSNVKTLYKNHNLELISVSLMYYNKTGTLIIFLIQLLISSSYGHNDSPKLSLWYLSHWQACSISLLVF